MMQAAGTAVGDSDTAVSSEPLSIMANGAIRVKLVDGVGNSPQPSKFYSGVYCGALLVLCLVLLATIIAQIVKGPQ